MSDDIGNRERIIQIEDLEYVEIQCADCESALLGMRKIKDTEDILFLTVTCPFCGGESWINELKGKYYQQPIKGTVIEDFIQKEQQGFLVRIAKDD